MRPARPGRSERIHARATGPRSRDGGGRRGIAPGKRTGTGPAATPPAARLANPTLLAAALAAALLLGAGPGLAQEAGPPRTPGTVREAAAPDTTPDLSAGELRVAAFAGALTPMAHLTEQEGGFGTELAVSGIFGADAVYWARPRIGVGVHAAYAPATLTVLPGQFTGAVPEDLGRADYLTFGADVRYRFPPPSRLVNLQPWVAAGVGLRVLDVQRIAEPEAADATDPVAALAAGTDVPVIDRFALRFEFRDRLSVYRAPDGTSRTQNDLSVIVGVSTIVR